MKQSEYMDIVRHLKNWDDVQKLTNRYRIEVLRAILAQRLVGSVRRDFYKTKAKAKKHLLDWKRGKSFVQIADESNFCSPLMMAAMILDESGMKKTEFRSLVREPDNIEDSRIRSEIKEALQKDLIYSPTAISRQADHGKQGEIKILKWLKAKKVKFKAQEEIKHESGKTPDFLLEEPLSLKGKQIHWIESKASFGDQNQIRRDYTRQLQHYVKHFGPGCVVYWLGFVEDLKIITDTKQILFLEENFFA
jgi:CDAN1-interacting nuclease 1